MNSINLKDFFCIYFFYPVMSCQYLFCYGFICVQCGPSKKVISYKFLSIETSKENKSNAVK